MAAMRGLRVVCAREIQKSLRDSVKQLIEDKIRSLGLSGAFDILDTEIRHKSNGSRFVFIGMWRNPDAVKSLEGADIFWGEEASAFSDRSIRIIRPTMRKPGSELWFSWNPEFDHDPVDKLFRGEHGPPPDSLVVEVSWRDNPWFDKSPLKAEMEFDYQSDPAKAEHVWGGGYVTAIDGAYYASCLAKAREEGRIGFVENFHRGGYCRAADGHRISGRPSGTAHRAGRKRARLDRSTLRTRYRCSTVQSSHRPCPARIIGTA